MNYELVGHAHGMIGKGFPQQLPKQRRRRILDGVERRVGVENPLPQLGRERA